VIFDLRSIARALGGEVSGHQVLAPGPRHSPRDRSLAIRLSSQAPDGFLVHSHAGDDWRECRGHVRSRLGLPPWEPGDERSRTIPSSHIYKWDFGVIDAETEDMRRTEDDLVRIERAQSLWREGVDPRRTAAEDYLRSRALALPDELAGSVLRFHPTCPWRDENTGRTERIPCLIAAFRSIDDDIITAIHRIRVDQPARWPKTDRRMLGVVHRSAIQLGAANGKLAIGEGVETCLAAMQLGVEQTAWALGSVGAISFFPVIDGVTELTILGEAGAASDRAIKICGRRWRRASRRVFVSKPKCGSDHNDVLMQRRVS
jgi:putative DNA primase/helicase